MASDTYPDDENIFVRIAEIQNIISSTSHSTKTPVSSVDDLPYWLMVIRSIATTRGVYKQSLWQFEVAMTLYREKAQLAQKNVAIMTQINDDMIATVKEFELRRELITPTYPTPPAQLYPDSLGIQCEGYTQDPIGNGGEELAGSFYVLTFAYEILQSDGAIEATKS